MLSTLRLCVLTSLALALADCGQQGGSIPSANSPAATLRPAAAD